MSNSRETEGDNESYDCTDKAHAHNSLHVIKMAGRFYGDITPRHIGRTPRMQESPIQIQPTSVASSSVHRSTSSQRGECEELEQPQPSVAEAMTLLGELKREMDALRTKSESQEKMITALSKSIEDVKREQSTPSQSVQSKAVPKDLLVSSNLFYYVYKIYTHTGPSEAGIQRYG